MHSRPDVASALADRPFQGDRENHREHDRVEQADAQRDEAGGNAADGGDVKAHGAGDRGEGRKQLRRGETGQQNRSDRPADHGSAPVKGDGLAGFLDRDAVDSVAAHGGAEERHAERRIRQAPDRIVVEKGGHLRADRDFRADVKEDRRAAEQRPARAQRIADERTDALPGAAPVASADGRRDGPPRQPHEQGQDRDDPA